MLMQMDAGLPATRRDFEMTIVVTRNAHFSFLVLTGGIIVTAFQI